MTKSMPWLAQLAAKSPATIRLGRDAFYAVDDLDFDEALDHLHTGLTSVASTEDAAEGSGPSRRSGHRSGWAGEPMDYRPIS